MPTRKEEKSERAKRELKIINEKIRFRSIGQKMKDNLYTSLICNNKDKLSPSRREQKRIEKLKVKINANNKV